MNKLNNWTLVERGDCARIEDLKTGEIIAGDVAANAGQYIVELHHREIAHQRALNRPVPDAFPFVVETIQRDGEQPRYRVSRKTIGGVYSDEFSDIKNACSARHSLNREEGDKEQLRYRTWQLEAIQRQQEILADIAFAVGFNWCHIQARTQERIMGNLNGSRGLTEQFEQWAAEFDKNWEARPEGKKNDYYIDIHAFTTRKLDALIEVNK